MHIYESISLNSSQNEKCFGKTVVQNIKIYIFYVQYIYSETLIVYEIDLMWKNMVQPNRPQVTTQYGARKTRSACRITQEHGNAFMLLPHNRFIPPDLVKCLTSTEKLGNNLSVVTIYLAKRMSKKDIRERKWFCFNAAFIRSV
jgi:hypothetical protein